MLELSEFAFQYQLTEEEKDSKKQEMDRMHLWGAKVEGELAAKLHMIPLPVYVNGRRIEMGGIASVASWPEYRRNGMVKQLLYEALTFMKKSGQVLSYLHPFSVPFYRKYGWELAFSHKEYTIPMDQLKRNWGGEGYVRRKGKEITLLQSIYTDFIAPYNGALVRDSKWWEHRLLKKETRVAVCYSHQNEPEGYILFHVKDHVMKVEEIAYTTINGQHLLMEFITNHDSMAKEVKITVPENDHLPWLLNEPRFEQQVNPYFMARIVDVTSFLKLFPFHNLIDFQSIAIHVEDDFFRENSGVYYLVEKDGEIQFSDKTNSGASSIYCTVQQLASMLLSYARPMQLMEMGLIKGDKHAIQQLEQVIPNKQTYLPDFF